MSVPIAGVSTGAPFGDVPVAWNAAMGVAVSRAGQGIRRGRRALRVSLAGCGVGRDGPDAPGRR